MLVGVCASMDADALSLDWTGYTQMEPATRIGWAQTDPDFFLECEITEEDGDETPFKAHRGATSSRAC